MFDLYLWMKTKRTERVTGLAIGGAGGGGVDGHLGGGELVAFGIRFTE